MNLSESLNDWKTRAGHCLAELNAAIKATKYADRITGAIDKLASLEHARSEVETVLRSGRRDREMHSKAAATLMGRIVDVQLDLLNASILRFSIFLSQLDERRLANPTQRLTVSQMNAEGDSWLNFAIPVLRQTQELIDSVGELCNALPRASRDAIERRREEIRADVRRFRPGA